MGEYTNQIQLKTGNNAKYSRTKLLWFSRLLRHSARKQEGLMLQRSCVNTGKIPAKPILIFKKMNYKHVILTGLDVWTNPLKVNDNAALTLLCNRIQTGN